MQLTRHEALDKLLTLPVVLSCRREVRPHSFCTYLLCVSRMPSTVLAPGATAAPEADTALVLMELSSYDLPHPAARVVVGTCLAHSQGAVGVSHCYFLRLHPLLSLVPKPACSFLVLCSSPRHQVANQKALIGSSLSHTLYPHDSILGVSGPREPA